MKTMFKLLELELRSHKVLGNIKLNFAADDEIREGPYSTVIIGPNGTGKSNLLRTITDIFREIENIVDRRKEQNLAACSYRIKYSLDGVSYEYTNSKRDLLFQLENQKAQCLKDGSPILPTELKLPGSIITSSVMLNDRFYVPKDYEGSIYNYLGVRRMNTPSVGGTQTYTRRIVDLLINKIDNDSFSSSLDNVLDLIGYEKELMLDFYPRYRTKLFTGNLTPEYLYNFYVNWEKELENRKNPPYGYTFFINHLKDQKSIIERLSSVINTISNDFDLNKKGRHFSFSFYDSNFINSYRGEIFLLGKLDLLSEYNIKFCKKNDTSNKNNDITSEEISSGEYHLFGSLVGILALIKEDSLILLDEPDISLHPNWQMKYVHFLKTIFSNYESCQFILATHSHFLVSDLEPSTSHLIGLRKNLDEQIYNVTLPKSTYGWSAEQILLDVFNVPTTRNYFIADKIGSILELVSQQNRDENLIRDEVLNLIDHNVVDLSDEDPLKPIINKLIEKYGQRS